MMGYPSVRERLGLDARERSEDRQLLFSAQQTVENFMDRTLTVHDFEMVQTAEDGCVILEELNPVGVELVRDMTAGETLESGWRLLNDRVLLGGGRNGHDVLVRYSVGYTKETLPQVFKESLLLLFLHRKAVLRNMRKGGMTAAEFAAAADATMPESVRELLEPYRRKRW